ncbi:hypothetical protein GO493_23940 [Chitinophaga sp. ysch24]|uniref:Uncharacterized protein n=2 Tax=Chitinophaga tropicalis TaxID=2683588 RepID=A0A7K1UAE1_9BACT|nr:hypothetical protein [Chitinophaga tropicalis]
MSNRNLCAVNRLTSQGRAYDGFGHSIYEFRSEQRRWQQIYERVKKYYSNQLLKLISEDYVNVNSFATL